MMKLSKIILLGVGLLVVGYVARQAYWHHQSQRLFKQFQAHHQLTIPGETRRILTNGTTDGVNWIESQLRSPEGSMTALYLLNAMLEEPIDPLPYDEFPLGWCGYDPKWKRNRYSTRRMRRDFARKDEIIEHYFANKEHMPLRPLPTVDWDDPADLNKKFLAAVEDHNIGMLLIFMGDISYSGPHSIRNPDLRRSMRFHRANGQYKTSPTTLKGVHVVPFDYCMPDGTISTEPGRFKFSIVGLDADGLPSAYFEVAW